MIGRFQRLDPYSRESAMTSVAECRERARQCSDEAEVAGHPSEKSVFLAMANTWTALSSQMERLEAIETGSDAQSH